MSEETPKKSFKDRIKNQTLNVLPFASSAVVGAAAMYYLNSTTMRASLVTVQKGVLGHLKDTGEVMTFETHYGDFVLASINKV